MALISGTPEWNEYCGEKRRERRQMILDALGGKCVVCGWSDIRALQIDHRNGGGTAELRALSNGHGLSGNYLYNHIIRMLKAGQIDKVRAIYQLLCANHNQIKKIEMQEHTAFKRGGPMGTERVDWRAKIREEHRLKSEKLAGVRKVRLMKINHARFLRAQGRTYSSIAVEIGMSPMTVYLWLNPSHKLGKVRLQTPNVGGLEQYFTG